MPRTIKVENICGRCGRTEEESMDMATAMRLEALDEARDVTDNKLEQTLNDALDDTYPDVIIAVRDAEGSYTVKGQRNLCDQPKAKRNKGCATRVKALIDDIFMVPKPKTSKKPKIPPTEPETSTTETPKVTTTETPKVPANVENKPKGTKKK